MDTLERLVRVDNLLMLTMLVCIAGALYTRRSVWNRALYAVVLGTILLGVLPIGKWMTVALENRFPKAVQLPDQIAGIIVLGGAFQTDVIRGRGQLALNEDAERVDAFLRLARLRDDAPLIFAGGLTSLGSEHLNATLPVERFFSGTGVEPNRVAFDIKSSGTYGNAINAASLTDDTGSQDRPWVLITSAFHMPRSVATFRKAGWHVFAWPVDYKTDGKYSFDLNVSVAAGLRRLALTTREWEALLFYHLSGRTDDLLATP